MPYRTRRSYAALIWTTLALAGYWIVAPFIGDNTQIEWLRAFQVGAFTAGAIFFVGSFLRLFNKGVPPSAQRFLLGIIVFFSGADGGASVRLLWRLAGGGEELDWMLTNDTVGFFLWAEVVGVVLMISAPTVSDSGGGHVSWRRLVLTGALCLAVGYATVVLRPDMQGLLNGLRAVIAPEPPDP